MIFEAIFGFFFDLFNYVLSPLDQINDIHLNIYFVETVIDCFKVATYILPVSKLLPIVAMILIIYTFRAVVSLIKTIWDLIPFL